MASRNEASGIYADRPVAAVGAHRDPVEVHLVLVAEDGTREAITTTPEHPFHVPGRGFVEALDLDAGMRVSRWAPAASSIVAVSSHANEATGRLTVASVYVEDTPFTAYNLTVGTDHTYYVGRTNAWVHNCDLEANKAKLELNKFRAELDDAGFNPKGAAAQLQVGDKAFFGMSGHGQPIDMQVNAISKSHAETDAFQQAKNAGVRGGTARLTVDKELCAACGRNGGIRGLAKQLGFSFLEIVTPSGTTKIRP